MDLLNEIVKFLSSPTWSGIGVLASSLLSIIALVLARKSLSKPDPPQQEPLTLASSIAALSLPGHRRSREWDDSDDNDPTGGVPDAYFSLSYWND